MQAEKMPRVVFGDRLRALMAEKGITQVELASSAGISQSAVSKWFKGSIPSGPALSACARKLGMTVEGLLSEAPQKKDYNLRRAERTAAARHERCSHLPLPTDCDMPGRLGAIEAGIKQSNQRQARMETQMQTLLSLLGERMRDGLERKKKAG